MELKIRQVDKSILNKNVELHGENIIKYYFIEEASELIKELTKSMRGKDNREEILEELSDVYYALSLLGQEYNITEQEINNSILFKESRAKESMGI